MPSRISGACNGCRSKKQKCSGDKSGCTQCEAAAITCTWPEQRKRGPAKGYIEGLEHRLHDAESLLLQVLPHVSMDQLVAATTHLANAENEDLGRASPDRRSSPPILNKKTGIDYWENFPLTSVDGIRRWQQDCEVHTAGDNNRPVKTEHRNSSTGTRMLSEDASLARKKRQSIPEHNPSSSYSGDVSALNELFGMQSNHAPPSQVIQAQNEQIRVALDQQRRQNSWQAQIMNSSSNQAGQDARIPQQLFTQVGYFGASGSNSWQSQQANMDMDMINQQSTQQDAIPAVSNQTHSHLFW